MKKALHDRQYENVDIGGLIPKSQNKEALGQSSACIVNVFAGGVK